MLLLLAIFAVPAAFGADGATPVASFTYSPSEPVTGQVVTFDGSRSTCASTPCTYAWSDDGPDGSGGTNWPLGTGPVLTFTFHGAGTKYVRLTVTDALGHTSTTEHDVTVAPSQQPPAAPANTVAPAITGTPQQGQTLTASEGVWTGTAPTTYSYLWSDGSTGATDTLTASNVGQNITVTVTATNAAGSATATSVPVGPVTALPLDGATPVASFTYSPAAPVTGQVVTFDGSRSTCASTPCTYAWSDDGSDGSGGTNWPLGTGPVLTFTFNGAGTKYVRLTVTGADSQTATVEHNVMVDSSPPTALVNTAAPAISGTATQGQTLSGSNGSWSGSPTSYAYQWRQCDSSGANCTNITGATSGSYTLSAGDVGDTLKFVVTATNAGGSSSATSAASAVVASGGSSGSCSVTLSSLTNVNASLTSGAVVCLTAGTYGQVSITTTPSSNATLTAAPGAHVVVGAVNIAASNITVSQLHSTGTINVGSGGPYPGYSHDVIDHNEVGPTNGYGISVRSATSTPSSFITISNNKIHDTSTTSEGDAIRLDGWHDITITGNDIYNIKECAGNGCHTDTLQSYQGGVSTSNLTITNNYVHDTNGAQGWPFLKDGDISNVTISDNLAVRMISNPQVTGIWVDENIPGLVITKNTYQSTSGGILQTDGSASTPSAQINHNVFDALNAKTGGSGVPYALSEDYNIWTTNNEYTFSTGAHDTKTSPGFVATSTDDYRLASNPNGIGIDWRPADQQYGPTN